MMLRWIVLVVLLGNIFAALWLYSQQEFRQVQSSADPHYTATPGIFLLDELSGVEIAKIDACVLHGAFANLSQALRVSNALEILSVRTALVTRDVASATDYAVTIPREDLRGSPAQMRQVLDANNISTVEFGQAESEGSISIGVFPSYSDALALKNRIRRLGYSGAIHEKQRMKRQYWLGISEAEQGKVEDFDWRGEVGQKITTLKVEMPCERVASPP